MQIRIIAKVPAGWSLSMSGGARYAALCGYIDPSPAEASEREGQRVGRIAPHERPTPTLVASSLEEFLKGDKS